MRRSARIPSLLAAALVLAATGCSRDEGGERVPLGASTSSTTLSAQSRAALDEGNAEFRAGRYEQALDAYRRAAAESPQDVAPLWGVQMAARALGDSALADSAVARMRAISPEAVPASGQDPHAGGAPALPPNHPSTGAPALPPNHPSTTVPQKTGS